MIYDNIFTPHKNRSWCHFHLFPIISNFGNEKSPKSSKNPHFTEKCSKIVILSHFYKLWSLYSLPNFIKIIETWMQTTWFTARFNVITIKIILYQYFIHILFVVYIRIIIFHNNQIYII